jgi:hypothetical protein
VKKARLNFVRHRLRRPSAVMSVFAAVIVATLSIASSPAVANPATAPATPRVSQTAASAAVQLFASKVETLGAEHYGGSFAGAALTPSGVTEVYALPASDAGLVRAIKAINTHGYRVTFVATRRSYNQLNALTLRLIAANNSLKALGVTPTQGDPDPASGSIQVSVEAPTKAALAKLSADSDVRARIGAPIAAANYKSAVSALLSEKLGPGYTVESKYSQAATTGSSKSARRPVTPADRFTDSAPFFGGDQIVGDLSGILCTGGFFVTGNRSGHDFLLTAGHCGQTYPDTFIVPNSSALIGPLSTNYWVPGTTNDYLTIYAPGGGLPYVWANGTTIHPVAGSLLPALKVKMTFDGSKTGEVPFSTVVAVNATDMNVVDSNSGRTYNIYPVVQATPPGTSVTCQKGDSGGPAYQRTNSTPVYAIGTIAAFFGGPGVTIVCSAEQIGQETSNSNTTLMTSP